MSHIIHMITVCEGRFKERRQKQKKRQGMTRQDNNTHMDTEEKRKLKFTHFFKEIAIQVHE